MTVRNYNKKTYNIQQAVNKAITSNPSLKHTPLSINYTVNTVGKTSILTVKLTYGRADVVVSNFEQFYAAIKNTVKANRTKVVLKINNYNANIYSLDKAFVRLKKEGIEKEFKTAQKILYFPGSKSRLLELVINYNNSPLSQQVNYSFTEKEIYNIIKEGLSNCEDSIKINSKEKNPIRPEIIKNIFERVTEDNPDLNYFDSYSISIRTSTLGSVITSQEVEISIDYSLPKERIVEIKAVENQRAKEIIDEIIKAGMSDYQKEQAIHDYIVNSARYDYENYIKNTIPKESHMAYGILVNKVGVCEGYALAMYKLLNMAGVECKVITGTANGEDHAWNIVKLDDGYYHVDATFDDPVINGGEISTLSHKYFNLTDKQIEMDHQWDRSKYPVCNGTKYLK
ncbi:copper amine oxidase [Fervidicella metallireducens AeB]|uniref:Copper amine oxidase n=1 Tax=Fervidicella metallireducens AeB TaxID=1403537 RepID=A0A017RS40_9CLOT|nr:transglutaminase domain-containing protein [Fervidicella metallireducens]EYE87457.1 copper amine oxidase [Fervidicella metallireducens AeB]